MFVRCTTTSSTGSPASTKLFYNDEATIMAIVGSLKSDFTSMQRCYFISGPV